MTLREVFSQAFSSIYRVSARGNIWEWAEEFFILRDKENLEHGGKFKMSTVPYQRFIFEFLQEPGKGELIINKCSRAGITFSAYVAAAWCVENEPKNILFVNDNEENASFESEERFQPMLKDSGILHRQGVPSNNLSRLLQSFTAMFIHWRSAGAEGAFDRIEVSWVFLDEMRSYSIGNSVAQARNRLKNKKNSKLMAFSEPSTADSEQEKEWKSSSQEEILLRCPHCDHRQPLIFQRLIFSHCKRQDGSYDAERVLKETYYKCSGKDECKILEHQRPLLWRHWLTEGSETQVRNKNHEHRLQGIQIEDIHSPMVPWGETALSWINAQGDTLKMQKLDTACFAKVPEMSYGEINDRHIISLTEHSSYERWEVPFQSDDVALVCQVIDTQIDSMKTVILAFDTKKNFAVVAWAELESLDECKEWGGGPILCADGYPVEVFGGVVDEGDGSTKEEASSSRRDEVREWCRENAHDGWQPIRGLGPRQVRGSIQISYASMPGYVNDQAIIQIQERVFKYELVYKNIKDHKKRLTTGEPLMHLPNQIDPELMSELQNEYFKKMPQAKGSAVVVKKWFKAGPNDYLDCIKYGKAFFKFLEPDLIQAGRLPAPLKKGEDLDNSEEA